MKKRLLSSFLMIGLLAAPLYAATTAATVITGDKMQILKNGQQVVFTGNARVKRAANTLLADKLIQNKKDKVIEAYGNVDFQSVTADTEPVRCQGGRAHYDIDLGTGQLWENRPLLTYWTHRSTAPLTMQADMIAFDQTKGEMQAEGAVNILSSSGTVSAPFAHLFQKEKRLVLENGAFQPEITYIDPASSGRYRADHIEMLMNEKRSILTGNVHGRVLYKEQPK